MDFVKNLLNVAKSVQEAADTCLLPPVEITPIDKHIVLSQSLFKSTRGYLENIVYQVNTSYENSCYDACSVMIRRLIEILIIETYEHNHIENKVKNTNGDFFSLDDLINGARHVESLLGKVIVLTLQNFLEAPHRLRHRHIAAFSTGKYLADEHWLR